MDTSDKRTERQALDTVAEGNRRWWTDHTMSYDWNDAIAAGFCSSQRRSNQRLTSASAWRCRLATCSMSKFSIAGN